MNFEFIYEDHAIPAPSAMNRDLARKKGKTEGATWGWPPENK
jgi:hypothetical protein